MYIEVASGILLSLAITIAAHAHAKEVIDQQHGKASPTAIAKPSTPNPPGFTAIIDAFEPGLPTTPLPV